MKGNKPSLTRFFGHVEIVRYKPNAEAVFREKKAFDPKMLSRKAMWALRKSHPGFEGELKLNSKQ